MVLVTELCRNGTLRDHIDVQVSLKAAAAACDSCGSSGSSRSHSSSSCDDAPPPPPLLPGSPQAAPGGGNAACRCGECQERASLQHQQQPMHWSCALPDLAFASADDGRCAHPVIHPLKPATTLHVQASLQVRARPLLT